MSAAISGKEIRWVLLWSIFIVGLSCLPYLYAYLVTPDDMQFTGLLSNPVDGNSYLAKMRQGARGNWLFHLPYTPEDHDGAFIFTYYLFLGRLSALLGLPLVLTYHLARVVNSLILLFVAWYFVSLFSLDNTTTVLQSKCHSERPKGAKNLVPGQQSVPVNEILSFDFAQDRLCFAPQNDKCGCCSDKRTRRTAFLLIGLSSGLGWLAVSFNVFAPDLWVPEAITFYSIFANPHFPLAVALMLLIFAFVIAPSRRNAFFGAVFSSVLLGIVQPFCVVTVYSVLGAYFILRFLKVRRLTWPEILRCIVAGAATAPIIAYDYYVYTFNPVLHAWSEQNITPSPPLWGYVIAYGFVLALAVGGAILAIRRRNKADLFLLAWVVVNGLLLYAPFSLQRRLVTGLHIPLCILAAMALSRYILPRLSPARMTLVLGAFIVLTMLSNLFVLMASMAGAAQHDSRLYLYRDEAEAMTWLEENTQPTDIVLASPEMGLFIPAWAGNRVLYGHPFETIEAEKKRALAETFYQAQTEESVRRGIVEAHHITYVFYGPRERALSGGRLEIPSMLSEAYANPGVTIYQMNQDFGRGRTRANTEEEE